MKLALLQGPVTLWIGISLFQGWVYYRQQGVVGFLAQPVRRLTAVGTLHGRIFVARYL